MINTREEALKFLVDQCLSFTGRLDSADRLEEINNISAAEILLGPVEESFCGNHCGWHGTDPGVITIEDLYDRLIPGREAPSGQCPQCGKLTFKQKDAGYVA